MPILKGYIHCTCCQSAAKVMEAEGKRIGKFYVVCPECGTDQSHLPKRQEYIRNHMVESLEQLNGQGEGHELEVVSDIVSEVISEPEPKDEKGVSGWVIGGAILLSMFGLGALARKVA